MSDSDCIFCQVIAGELPSDTVYETENTIAIKDLHPAADLHVLVLPRRHITDASEVTAEDGPLMAEMLMAARAVADQAGLATPERGYRLIFNIGPDAMNSVPHLHLHVLGGNISSHLAGQ
jgi:histidine triad (HIT) family protein